MYILGIGDVTHDTSVCLMKDGKVVAAIEEERLTRVKHNMILDPKEYTLEKQGQHFYNQIKNLTVEARERKHKAGIKYCLEAAKITPSQIDCAVISSLFVDLPFRHPSFFIHHHMAHAASAFYPSPFEQAAVLVVDGYGSYTEGVSESVSYGIGRGNRLDILNFITGHCDFSKEEKQKKLKETQIVFKNSLGVFYQNISVLMGMGYFGEGKTMGLAAYGKSRPEFKQLREYIDLLPDGQLDIDNRSIFIYCSHLIEAAKKCLNKEKLFQFYADLAYEHQALLEMMLIHCCDYLYEMSGEKNICLAGGVALNSVANRKILEKTKFENIFIQPAAGDNGIAIGCALYGAHILGGRKRGYQTGKMFSPYLGKTYSKKEIGVTVKKYVPQLKEIKPHSYPHQFLAEKLSEGKIVAWFQGGSEIGPRALGNRSILADPRCRNIKEIISSKVKRRESFRPFAPSILSDYVNQYFELPVDSPYMLLVAKVKLEKRFVIPSVTHIDGTARVQVVHEELSPSFYTLIQCFHEITGVPLLLNTSFNGKMEPIVETPENAIECFLNNNIDFLFLEGRVFVNAEISPSPLSRGLSTERVS